MSGKDNRHPAVRSLTEIKDLAEFIGLAWFVMWLSDAPLTWGYLWLFFGCWVLAIVVVETISYLILRYFKEHPVDRTQG